MLVIAPHGGVFGKLRHKQVVERTKATARSIEFDAVVVADGAPKRDWSACPTVPRAGARAARPRQPRSSPTSGAPATCASDRFLSMTSVARAEMGRRPVILRGHPAGVVIWATRLPAATDGHGGAEADKSDSMAQAGLQRPAVMAARLAPTEGDGSVPDTSLAAATQRSCRIPRPASGELDHGRGVA